MHQQQFCHLDAKYKKELKLAVNILCFRELTFCILVIQFIRGKKMHGNGISQHCWKEAGFADSKLQTLTRNSNGKFVSAFHLAMKQLHLTTL